ncbi:MAG: lipase [Sterolibacteriaceae bacterium]|jgi:triacylglycerol lipase|nr:lipase [Sterolibacteriaceae bacterium]MBK9085171.1 lipase [Sterolibacteriaceae bacterium]
MLASVLTLILFVEMFVYCGYAVARVVLGAWSPGFAILFILGMPIVLRGLLTAIGFAVSWFFRSPRPQSGSITLLEGLWMFVREWAAMSFQYGFGQAFESVFVAPDRLRRVASGETPVLLVHGYLCNRGVWWWLKPRIENAGHVVATVTLEPVLGEIDDGVRPLMERIEAVCRETGASRVTLVCHSMGGLTARAYVRACGSERVARLITIATPHQGSAMARFGLGRNARQMRDGSAWIAALGQAALPAALPVVSIYSLHDSLLVPQDNAILPGAQLMPLTGRGHNEMLISRATLDFLLGEFDSAPTKAQRHELKSEYPASIG